MVCKVANKLIMSKCGTYTSMHIISIVTILYANIVHLTCIVLNWIDPPWIGPLVDRALCCLPGNNRTYQITTVSVGDIFPIKTFVYTAYKNIYCVGEMGSFYNQIIHWSSNNRPDLLDMNHWMNKAITTHTCTIHTQTLCVRTGCVFGQLN